MIYPSGLRRPEDANLDYDDLGDGFYKVKNAYVGHYEYFPGYVLVENAGMPVKESVDKQFKDQQIANEKAMNK